MRVTVQMLYTRSWIEIARISVPNVVDYCWKHGYRCDIRCIDEPYDGYEKIRNIKAIFDRDEADLVWSIDCDLLITNYNLKIEQVINAQSVYDFWICKDYNGVNAGSFVVRNCPTGIKLLDFIYDQKGKEGMYCEQDAINKYISVHPDFFVIKILPHPTINSYLYELYPEIPPQSHEQGQWQEEDFVLHLPGVSMDKRKEILSNTKITK